MKIPRFLLAALLAVSVLTVTAFAADLAGHWKWTSVSKANGPSEVTAQLVVKDGVITGTVTGRQGPADISEGTFKDDAVAFAVVRTSSFQTVTFKYYGKLAGDTITGTIERPGKEPGAVIKTDWKATRTP